MAEFPGVEVRQCVGILVRVGLTDGRVLQVQRHDCQAGLLPPILLLARLGGILAKILNRRVPVIAQGGRDIGAFARGSIQNATDEVFS